THAAVIVRLLEIATSGRLSYRFPPKSTGPVKVSVYPVRPSRSPLWSGVIAQHDHGWLEATLPLLLDAGDYLVAFDTERTWSNPGQRDPALPPDNRSLAFALASL